MTIGCCTTPFLNAWEQHYTMGILSYLVYKILDEEIQLVSFKKCAFKFRLRAMITHHNKRVNC